LIELPKVWMVPLTVISPSDSRESWPPWEAGLSGIAHAAAQADAGQSIVEQAGAA